jgi:hypothetical protein
MEILRPAQGDTREVLLERLKHLLQMFLGIQSLVGNGWISRLLEVFHDSGGVDCQEHQVVQVAEGVVPLFSGVIDVQHAEAA